MGLKTMITQSRQGSLGDGHFDNSFFIFVNKQLARERKTLQPASTNPSAFPNCCRSFHQLRELILHRGAPNVVALGLRVKLSARKRSGRKYPVVVQELGADVQVENVALVVELRNNVVDVCDLVADRVAGDARAERSRARGIFASGKSLRISSTTAPMPSAISAAVKVPALLVPIMSMTAFGWNPWPSPFFRPQRTPCVVSPAMAKLAVLMSPKYLSKTALLASP